MSTFGCQFWGFQPGYSLWKPRADLAWPLQLLLHVWPCFLHLIENPSNIVEYSQQPQLNKIMFQSQIWNRGFQPLNFAEPEPSRASRAHGRPRRAALPTQQPSTCSAWHGIDWTRPWLPWPAVEPLFMALGLPHGGGSKPIINSNGMNIHLPAILGFTRCQGFDQ